MPFCIDLIEFDAFIVDSPSSIKEKHTRIGAPELMNKGSKDKQDENMQAPSVIILDLSPVESI